jgi:hypothetical protein
MRFAPSGKTTGRIAGLFLPVSASLPVPAKEHVAPRRFSILSRL